MKFSIIMPAYNAEKTILSSIESVLNQTYTNWELIIIDDCSNDKTFKVASNVAKSDPRVHLIKNTNNLGAGQSRNKGLKKASSHLVAFLDSDDTWKIEKLQIYANHIKKNNDVLLFCSAYDIVKHNKKKIFHIKQSDLAKRSLLKENKIGLSTVVINLKNLKNNSHFQFPSNRRCEDYRAWLDLISKRNKFFAITLQLTTHRIMTNSLSSNKILMLISNYKILRMVLENNFLPIYYLACQSKRSLTKNFLGFR